jgi:probable rRNA maturation factor
MIDFEFIDVEIPGFNSEFFVWTIEDIIVSENCVLGELSVIFCKDDYLLNINQTYLNHDYYTDIITFEYSKESMISGDLFISVDRIKENALIYNVSFSNELTRVIYHGTLHLCGYKDKSAKDVLLMREKENYYLDKFVSRETN